MSTHTPGPWEQRETVDVSTDDEIQEWAVKIGAPAHMETAVAYGSTPDEAEANARLIAAAPALLEALQEVRRDITRAAKNNVIWPTTVKMIDAAIAATGEQS